ncbi:MAG: AAA family ATPase [Candidatus Omnitrophica bacterium]|jgi:superfamily I DNA/RNA helicase|nr:AAA family ATPase [Candidatus Omnitrophota bacterium]
MNKLPDPVGKQIEVLYLPAEGHVVVLGTAGSGKTTLAILRAVYLANPSTEHGGRTLLVTFNKALVTYLKYLCAKELQSVRIENYHTFARGYLNSRGKMRANTILDNREPIVAQAIQNVSRNYRENLFFNRSVQFFSEEIGWISRHGIVKEEQYVDAERIGQLSRLDKKNRPVMFKVYSEYLKIRSAQGKDYDWDDIATHVLREFIQDDSERLYRHVVIDEGQDFSPEMLRSLAAAIPKDGSLTLFGDMAQQIYGQRMTWKSAGLAISKPWKFIQNYRNTREIARLGLAISKMPYFADIPDMVEPSQPQAQGALPTLVRCRNKKEEISVVMSLVNADSKTKNVAILLKNREQESYFKSQLPGTAVRLHRDMKTWITTPGVRYGTYNSAKGLEFDKVIIPFLSEDNLPDSGNVATYGSDAYDGKRLYVAVTRAKKELALIYSGEKTRLLPPDATLYKEVSA